MSKWLVIFISISFTPFTQASEQQSCQSLKDEADELNTQLRTRSTESTRIKHRQAKLAYLECLRDHSKATKASTDKSSPKHVGNKRPRSARYNRL
jgi:hypothetical protein